MDSPAFRESGAAIICRAACGRYVPLDTN